MFFARTKKVLTLFSTFVNKIETKKLSVKSASPKKTILYQIRLIQQQIENVKTKNGKKGESKEFKSGMKNKMKNQKRERQEWVK